jgi:hypothetical protein
VSVSFCMFSWENFGKSSAMLGRICPLVGIGIKYLKI